ncbi:uncharacterized protein isoform X2 [Rhodnius prolixus]
MAPKKKCSCCECTKKKKEKDCSQYPAGIQKEDLLWAYFVMRMVCDVLGEPQLLPKIMGYEEPSPVTLFDIVIMCAAARNPQAYKKVTKEAKKAMKKTIDAEKKKKKAEEEKRAAEAEEQRKREEEEAARNAVNVTN